MKTLVFLIAFLGAACVVGEDKCPISGAPAKDAHFLEVNGKKVNFCCDKCPEAYKKKMIDEFERQQSEKAPEVKAAHQIGREGAVFFRSGVQPVFLHVVPLPSSPRFPN